MPIKTSGPMNNNFDTSCLRANSSSGRVIKYSGKSIESGTYNVKLWKSLSSLRQVEGSERSSVLGMSCLTTVLLLELTLKAWKVKRNARRIQCILRSIGGTVGRLPGNAYLWLPISFFLGPPPCRKAILLFIRTPYIARMSCAISRRMHFQCNPPRKTYKKCQIATKKKKLATHQVSTTTNSHPPLRQTERQAVKSSMDSPTEMVHAESVQKFVHRSSICKGLFVYWN